MSVVCCYDPYKCQNQTYTLDGTSILLFCNVSCSLVRFMIMFIIRSAPLTAAATNTVPQQLSGLHFLQWVNRQITGNNHLNLTLTNTRLLSSYVSVVDVLTLWNALNVAAGFGLFSARTPETEDSHTHAHTFICVLWSHQTKEPSSAVYVSSSKVCKRVF